MAACHANPGEVQKQAGSSSFISRHMLQKFPNTSANNNVSPKHTNHDILLNFEFQNLYKVFLCM